MKTKRNMASTKLNIGNETDRNKNKLFIFLENLKAVKGTGTIKNAY